GLGYSMVEAQGRMQTDSLMALMILAALVGFFIDRLLQFVNTSLTKWRYVK
ncbi:MAG: ABC transporter permease subunit, partial [Clostridium sp.]